MALVNGWCVRNCLLRNLLFWLAICLCTQCAAALAAESSEDHPTLKAFFNGVTNSSAATRIPAVVTYVDPAWKTLFVQDETDGCLIRDPGIRWNIEEGDRVLVGGRKPFSTNNTARELIHATLQKIGPGQLPNAVKVRAATLLDGSYNARLVEVHGVVRSFVETPRLFFMIEVEGQSVGVWVHHYQPADINGLLDAELTVQGVSYPMAFDLNNPPTKPVILVSDFKKVQVVRPGPAQPFAMDATPIEQIGGVSPRKRVLVRGWAMSQKADSSLSIRNGTNQITIYSRQRIPLMQDDWVEAIGFPLRVNGSNVLMDALFRIIERAATSKPRAIGLQSDAPLPLLTSIKQVLELTRDQAQKAYPLRVTGVVTLIIDGSNAFLLQDGNDAIYVSYINVPSDIQPGKMLEVTGVTKPGGVLTMISGVNIAVKGETNLPVAKEMTFRQGMTENFDCKRVKVTGVIQSVLFADNYLYMDLVANDGRIACMVPDVAGSPLRTNLINKLVEVEGVSMLQVDEMGAPTGLLIGVRRESDIRIVQNSPTQEFAVRSGTIRNLFGYVPPEQSSYRVKVRGIVTLWRPGRELYVQDPTGAIRAQTDLIDPLAVGDEVEVIGYRDQSDPLPALRNAEYSVVSKSIELTPKLLNANEVLSASNHGMLLSIEARLLEDARPSAAPELGLQAGETFFTGALEAIKPGDFPAWRANSLLRVTGVCLLKMNEAREFKSFRLLIRSPSDVLVLQQPPWITAQKILVIALLLLATVVVALGWVAALRRRVFQQTDLIRRRLEAEAAIERRLALVWEASADGMRMTDAEGLAIQVNNAYCSMMQKNRVDLEGGPFWTAFNIDSEPILVEEHKKRFARRTDSVRQEISVQLWNGQKRWFDVTDQFIEHTQASPLILSQYRDITERKLAEEEKVRLQEQLAQAQKTESIGRLAGGVAHDFNNMLQVIIGNTMIALEETPPGSPIHEALADTLSSAERAAETTRQLLAFARKQTIRPKILDLNERIASMLKILQRLIGENIQTVWIPGIQLGHVNVDPAQIDQILINLCVNARDAIKETGRITIRTANAVVPGNMTDSDSVPGEYVKLSVSDTGCGMDAETREHLFEPFFTTKDIGKGTGLGLATVFGIVKQNAGFIEVASEPGKGAMFMIYLPRVIATVSAPASVGSMNSQCGKETILLVEDEEKILDLWRRTLTQCGYHVVAVLSPYEALDIAEPNNGPIHLLITDVIMPGMNGKELFQKIQPMQPGIRCLFMSGYTAETIAHHGVLEEGIHFLQKPFGVQTLTLKIRELLDPRG